MSIRRNRSETNQRLNAPLEVFSAGPCKDLSRIEIVVMSRASGELVICDIGNLNQTAPGIGATATEKLENGYEYIYNYLN
jgi:hypothetical protein